MHKHVCVCTLVHVVFVIYIIYSYWSKLEYATLARNFVG